MTELVLLRHGRTSWNAVRRIQGQSESTLDEVGHTQAAATAPALASLEPTALWTSDSRRARETAAYLERATGLEARVDARLREYSLGEREGLTHPEFEALAPGEYAEFVRGNWDGVPSAETYAAVAERMCAALEEAVTDSDRVLVVSHGAAIRTAAARLMGWTRDQHAGLRALENCGWAVLHRDPDRAGHPRPAWRLAAYNRVVDYRSPDGVG